MGRKRTNRIAVAALKMEKVPLLHFGAKSVYCRCARPYTYKHGAVHLDSVLNHGKRVVGCGNAALCPPTLFSVLSGVPRVGGCVMRICAGRLKASRVLVHVKDRGHDRTFTGRVGSLFHSGVQITPDVGFRSTRCVTGVRVPPVDQGVIGFVSLEWCFSAFNDGGAALGGRLV